MTLENNQDPVLIFLRPLKNVKPKLLLNFVWAKHLSIVIFLNGYNSFPNGDNLISLAVKYHIR